MGSMSWATGASRGFKPRSMRWPGSPAAITAGSGPAFPRGRCAWEREYGSDQSFNMIPAQEALARLREGNRRFVENGAASAGRPGAGQQPFAIVLGCSDSRDRAALGHARGQGSRRADCRGDASQHSGVRRSPATWLSTARAADRAGRFVDRWGGVLRRDRSCGVFRRSRRLRDSISPSTESTTRHVGGHEVTISNPAKVLFPKPKYTKLDLANYYLAVAEGALRGAGGRPNMLVRFPNGIGAPSFYQKRAPESRPSWIEVVTLRFPSGRTADEVVPRDPASLVWLANLGCLELPPHPVRTEDLDHPDELRVDLDPVPGIKWPQVRQVAQLARAVLADFGLVGWPKTSGSRGMHLFVRIERRWGFDEVRRSALALAREVERRGNGLATSKWWKAERQGVFVDYNQNAKDRTVASAYSVRPVPDARVSAPLSWDEVDDADPEDFTLGTMPQRFAKIGDRHAGMDESAGSLEGLLDLSARQEKEGQGDAPWPPP